MVAAEFLEVAIAKSSSSASMEVTFCFLLVCMFVCAGVASLPVAWARRFHQPPHGLDGVSATPPEGDRM